MKVIAITLSLLAIALVMVSCVESQQKNQASSLEEQAMVEEANTKIVRSYNQITPLIKEVYFAFPDYKHEIEIIFASGQYVTVKVDHIGTHSNTYMGIQPTGKMVSYKSIFIFTLEDGLITDVHGMEEDLAALIQTKECEFFMLARECIINAVGYFRGRAQLPCYLGA